MPVDLPIDSPELPTHEMINQRSQAEALATCMEHGRLDVSDAIAWADQQILETERPHSVLCEVAMALAGLKYTATHLVKLGNSPLTEN